MDELTDEEIIRVGGWDPRFARVLAKAADGPRAIAIVGSNGAAGGRVYENQDWLDWDPEVGWRAGASGNSYQGGWRDGLAVAAGNGIPGEVVVLTVGGSEYTAVVEPTGYWAFAILSDDAIPEVDRRSIP